MGEREHTWVWISVLQWTRQTIAKTDPNAGRVLCATSTVRVESYDPIQDRVEY